MKSGYLRGFVHDIRNSVGIIQSCLSPDNRLDPHDGPEKDEVDFREMAARHAEKALSLISDLEDTLVQNDERMDSAPVTGSELHSLFDEFLSLYPRVTVRFNCSPDFRIHTDLKLLRRILDNCIVNAFRAGQAKNIKLICESDDDVIFLHVKDDGCGMSQHQLERLGLGFSTTGGGEGVKILIDLLVRAGGAARWNSIEEVGTSVTLVFKISPTQRSPATRSRLSDEASRGSDTSH